ncbi:MAG TPA: hypothetical protein VF622_02330 [Segetibacter sp.]
MSKIRDMEVNENIAGSTDVNTYITSAFKCLLADEFIIMNKTSSCLLDASSPFISLNNYFFQNLYDEVKRNSELVTSALKQKTKNVCITINDIVTNTSLTKKDINWKSKVAVLETLLADNLVVLSRLDEVITDLTVYSEKECKAVFATVRESHRRICMKLRLLIKKVMNAKTINTDKEPG